MKERHRRDQRVGRAVGEDDDLPVLHAGGGTVRALGEQHLRRQGEGAVLDELFELSKALHRRGGDALHASQKLGKRVLARDALHVEMAMFNGTRVPTVVICVISAGDCT